MSFLFNILSGVAGSAATNAMNGRLSRATSYSPPRKIVRDGSDKLYYNEELDPTWRIFGIPGASLYSAVELDPDAREAGIKGEEKVAAAIDSIIQTIPNAYLFNSVKLPGRTGDIDHIIVVGNNVILIDSKNWKHDASYQLTKGNTPELDHVYRDQQVFPGGEIRLAKQKQDWADFLPGYNVSAILVVANEEAFTSIHVETGYDFVNLLGLGNSVRRLVNPHGADQLLYTELQRFAGLAQNPDFDPTDETNYVWVNDFVQPQNQVVNTLKPTTKTTKGLMWWSILNYVLIPFIFPVAALSAIPLIIMSHKELKKNTRNGTSGKGTLIATLVFSYILLFAWIFGVALAGIYFTFMR